MDDTTPNRDAEELAAAIQANSEAGNWDLVVDDLIGQAQLFAGASESTRAGLRQPGW